MPGAWYPRLLLDCRSRSSDLSPASRKLGEQCRRFCGEYTGDQFTSVIESGILRMLYRFSRRALAFEIGGAVHDAVDLLHIAHMAHGSRVTTSVKFVAASRFGWALLCGTSYLAVRGGSTNSTPRLWSVATTAPRRAVRADRHLASAVAASRAAVRASRMASLSKEVVIKFPTLAASRRDRIVRFSAHARLKACWR